MLAASSAIIPSAQAAEGIDGNMLRMFDISTPSAGKVNFIGTGTANFNQSIGTQNNFNVGSSTNLGVNASASSTEDYTAEGKADLKLAGTSRLQQTIGTATSAFNVATATEASSTAAHTSAFEVANGRLGTQWTSDYSNTLQTGWEHRASGDTGFDAAKGEGWYNDSAQTGEDDFVAAANADKDTAWQTYSEAEWQSDWNSAYDGQYETSYQSAVTAAQSSSSNSTSTSNSGGESQAGIISGVFSTIDYGSATSEVTASDTSSMDTNAKAAAAEHIVATTDSNTGDTTYAIATDGNGVAIGNYASQTSMTQEEMKSAYDKEYTKSFNAAFSSAAGLMRSSDSTVTVKGIGVIADVNASEASSFMAHSNLITGADRDGNGNGNASSGASLATSSYANQSNASTASAFMQAFSGGLPETEGSTVVTKVEQIVDTDPNTTGNQAGYKIYTDTVKTVTEDTSYSVDASGVLTAL